MPPAYVCRLQVAPGQNRSMKPERLSKHRMLHNIFIFKPKNPDGPSRRSNEAGSMDANLNQAATHNVRVRLQRECIAARRHSTLREAFLCLS